VPLASVNSKIPPVHFIGGIHGVGKTTFAAAISNTTGLQCQSAGTLIKCHRNTTQGESKQVKNVQRNQNLLLEAIEALHLTAPLLLDGHFCLLTNDNSITQIPFDTFADLNLKSITVVTDAPENIRRRLAERDGTNYDSDLLRRFQSSELAWAEEIGHRLQIPTAAFSCDEMLQANEHIQRADSLLRP
jgi:adenylate kinase